MSKEDQLSIERLREAGYTAELAFEGWTDEDGVTVPSSYHVSREGEDGQVELSTYVQDTEEAVDEFLKGGEAEPIPEPPPAPKAASRARKARERS